MNLPTWTAIREKLSAAKVEAFVEAAIAHEQPAIGAKIKDLRASGVSIITIALALAPFAFQLLSGVPVDWTKVLAVLEGLLVKP